MRRKGRTRARGVGFVPWVLAGLGLLLLGLSGEGRSRAWVVVVDAGHGGRDPGAIGYGGVLEKDVTLEIARLVRFLSLSEPRIEVVLTRWFDETLSLRERIALAESVRADLYISVHANAYGSPHVGGVETLIAEGAASGSRSLAEKLQRSLVSELRGLGVPDRGVKSQRLYLRWTRIPSALVEVGFLTHPTEAQRLRSLWYQLRVAQGIWEGIQAYLQGR